MKIIRNYYNLIMENCFVSIVLPVYNAQETIAEAIYSILCQTFVDFELILINDGSTDDSESVIGYFKDPRIQYYTNEKNKGLIYTLNRGISLAKGKYIARMDADDIAMPTRLEKQIRIMEQNSNIIVCGTRIKYFGVVKRNGEFMAPETSEENKAWLLEEVCFAHPTVMIRKDVLINNQIFYNSDYKNCEDYKLWVDLSEYGDYYNIQEPLLKYRLSDTQITQKTNTIQLENARRCRREYWAKIFGKDFNLKQIDIHVIRQHYKYKSKNKYVIEILYLSLSKYTLFNLLYYLFSLDWIQIRFMANLAIIKRFIKGQNPLI